MSSNDTHPAHETHRVFNQPPSLEPYNLFDSDVALYESVQREGGVAFESQIRQYGKLVGMTCFPLGFQANQNKPVFHSHDRYGTRIDWVEFHPSYHQLMETAIRHGEHSLPWTTKQAGGHVARAAMEYMRAQVESGTGCPLTMTYASVPAIRRQADVAEYWEPLITARHYDPANVPVSQKQGVTIGMAMTEKQGGSDVRANTTRAVCVGRQGGGGDYELNGHKWFCSAPMCDAFLVLAQAEGGLSCFLMPRWRPDGTKNAVCIQRLKNKLGNASNASSEIELRGAYAQMLGDPGRGVATIIEMVALTRFDCMVGSSALMRQAVAQATHHCAHRTAFGKTLADQPLMQTVLADLILESEAALALTMRIGRSLDQMETDENEAALARIVTAIGKFWICKRAPAQIYESMECLGGAGYVEESIVPRLYREAPVNSIWEGSGNVQCLDVLRAIGRDSQTLDVLLATIQRGKGKDAVVDRELEQLKSAFAGHDDIEYRARQIIERCALLLQAVLLMEIDSQESGQHDIAGAFIESRLRQRSGIYGTPLCRKTSQALIQRSTPYDRSSSDRSPSDSVPSDRSPGNSTPSPVS